MFEIFSRTVTDYFSFEDDFFLDKNFISCFKEAALGLELQRKHCGYFSLLQSIINQENGNTKHHRNGIEKN